jgi:hypothetical protein
VRTSAKTISLFTWGYWGWGNATERLLEAFDLAERARGFEPPIFVDCRLRRQGRAKGFVGEAFKDLVGPMRYHWMQDLGNEEIATGGKGVRIRNPAAVGELLDLALRAADENRRIIFYCACEYPRLNGELACHRLTIAGLLINHAKKVAQRLAVVEWPGGELHETRLKVERDLFASLMGGTRKSIPFRDDRLKEFAVLPWGSLATIQCEGDDATGAVLVGPVRFATSTKAEGSWYLPVIAPPEPGATRETLRERAAQWRKAHGLDARKSQ